MLTVGELIEQLDCYDDNTIIGIGYNHRGKLKIDDDITSDLRIVRKGDRVEQVLYFRKRVVDPV